MTEIAEFRLRLDRTPTPRTYRVTASGHAGEASGEFEVPFTEIELENFVLKVGWVPRGVRGIESPEAELAKTFGARLFSAVIDGAVGELYRASSAEARASGLGLRFTLLLADAQELSGVPWEFLYDRPNFLATSRWTPVVRSLDLPAPGGRSRLSFQSGFSASSAHRQTSSRWTSSESARSSSKGSRSLVRANAVSIDWIEEANLLALTRKLRSDTYHVLHYIGHGGFDSASGDQALLFEDDAGRSRRVSGDQLGTILRDKLSLRLVLFQSGEGAVTSLQDSFAGVAMSLVKRDIPAVVAMQFGMTDRAAMVFAGEFYSTLAAGESVDAAITEARRAIFATGSDVEWAAPVLFLGATDGRLFDIAAPVPAAAVATPVLEAAVRLPAMDDDPHLYVDENVQFTVYRPRAIRPARWSTLLAFAHLAERRPDEPDEPDPLEEVRRQAQQVLGKDFDSFADLSQDSSVGVPREGEITFLPHAPGVEFNPVSRTFRWLETVHREEFRLRATRAQPGEVIRGRLTVFLGVRLLAEIQFQLRVAEPTEEPRPTGDHVKDEARPYHRIFASYSHRDVSIVEQFERFVASTGAKYLRDVVDLRAGENWSDRLEEMIREADVFQLFWSSNSMRSKYVRREWEYALSLNRPYFVRPTYWEDPLPRDATLGLPPTALSSLHFYRLALEPTPTPHPDPVVEAPVVAAALEPSEASGYAGRREPSVYGRRRTTGPVGRVLRVAFLLAVVAGLIVFFIVPFMAGAFPD